MPKVETFDFVVPGTPTEVAARLQAVTRPRWLPHQGSIFGRGGLGGRVTDRSFTVADDPRTWFQLSQAVATGTLEAEGAGSTRVRGQASLPTWLTWQLRLAFVGIAGFVGLLLATVAGPAALAQWQAAVLLGAYCVVALLGGGVAIGMNVANADAGVAPLVERVRAAASGGAAAEARRVPTATAARE
jgi:hypothetical protein